MKSLKVISLCQIKIYASLSSRYENDKSQRRLAYNDIFYYENYQSQIRLTYNDFIYYENDHIQIRLTYNDFFNDVNKGE